VRQPRLREPFDLLGGLLIVAALVMLSLGLGSTDASPPARVEDFQSAEEAGRGMAWPLLVLAVLAFVLFVLVERWRKYPLFNLSIYRERNVAIAAFANVCVGFTLTIGLVTMPILVNIREAQTSLEGVQEAALIAGLLLSALTVPMALSAIPGGWLSDKRGYRAAVAGGLALSVFGFALMGFSWGADTPYALMGLQMAITGTGLGLTIAPIGAAVVNAAKPSERGGASGMVLALRLLGMTLALSSLTNFAIGRVNRLVQERTLAGDTRTDLYLITSVEVVRELMLLGMVISLVALAAAWFMRGGSAGETLEEVEETALEESARPSEPVPAA
jgi:MFS family permease